MKNCLGECTRNDSTVEGDSLSGHLDHERDGE